nr:peptide chain release factor N(5)-glutamine methyltransferase [Octadecabacter dasysiphoniae]
MPVDLAGVLAAHSDEHAIALAVRLGRQYLEFASNPDREAKVLLVQATGRELHNLTRADFDAATMDRYIALCERRRAREPMAHILGTRDFWKHSFVVTKDVLDPRPDTETLVQAALEVPFARVLDLGTGSGCILISVLADRSGATGVGADVSEAALEVAAQNVMAIGVYERCVLVQSDWFEGVDGTFDLIVSNPPYIAEDEMPTLAPELSFEPRIALTDGGDGLSCYRILADGAGAHLNAGGWLMVEIGPTQAGQVAQMFRAAGLVAVGIRRDLDGRDRVVVGQKPL